MQAEHLSFGGGRGCAPLLAGALIGVLVMVESAPGETVAAPQEPAPEEARVRVIPQPVKLSQGSGRFVITPDTTIVAGEELREIADQLARGLTPALGAAPRIAATAGEDRKAAVVLRVTPSLQREGPEAYNLSVSRNGILLRGASPAGVFYGAQTLRQLLPTEAYGATPSNERTVAVPEVRIHDYPRFAWRGLMLDSCRHFLPVESVKKFIDLMALHKLNTLHWHLTEDQGWRIEIKQYPRLTEIGSRRSESPRKGNRNEGDGVPYGPHFYTQDEIRDVLAYAAARFITVVPEIELPGHSRGALAAYPELGCTGGPYEVRTAWGVEEDIYCAGREETFAFLENVLAEVVDLFPSTFIHIGGDEAPKARWEQCPRCQARIKAEGLENEHELQSYFIQRIETFLNEKDRRLIGWDEILEGGLAPNASVMSWRGEQGGITAARSGHDVVMSPTSHCYFDYAQARGPDEPEAIGGYLPLRKVYSYDPVPAVLSPEEGKHVLGVQGNLWSEYLFDPTVVEYFAFPRACALSEVAWTPADRKDYADFLDRLPTHLERLDGMDVNYRPLSEDLFQQIGEWRSGQTSEAFQTLAWDFKPRGAAPGTYRIRFQYTGGAHRLDIAWCEITRDGERVAVDEHPGTTGGTDKDSVYTLSLEAPAPGAAYQLRAHVRSDGGSDSQGEVLVEAFTPR